MTKKHIDMYESGHLIGNESSEPIVLHTTGLSGCIASAVLFGHDNGEDKAIFLSHFPPTGDSSKAERNISEKVASLRDMGFQAVLAAAIIAPGRLVREDGVWITKPYESIASDIRGYEAALGVESYREGYVPDDDILFRADPDEEFGKGTARLSYDPRDKYSKVRLFSQGNPVPFIRK